MSTMLEQAIIDANALREAALQNAESAIIEKYSVSAEAMLLSINKTRYVELKRKKRESAIKMSPIK